MNTRTKSSRTAIPGAFPSLFSRGDSSQSSSGSSSNEVLVTQDGTPNVEELVHAMENVKFVPTTPQQTTPAPKDVTPKDASDGVPQRNGRKNQHGKKTPGRSPAPADEMGLLVEGPESENPQRGKGKGKAKAAPLTARLVNKGGVGAKHPIQCIDISSDDDDHEVTTDIAKLRKELAEVKKALAAAQQRSAPHRKGPSQAEVARLQKEIVEQAKELQVVKQREEKLREGVMNTLQCQICIELLYQPYALSPCGHVCCLTCLQGWFSKSGDDDDFEDDPRYRLKTCPYCRARIKSPPVRLFIVKSLIEIIDPEGCKAIDAATGLEPGDDPWAGFFSDEEEEDDDDYYDEDEDEDYVSETSHSEPVFCEACGQALAGEGPCAWCGLDPDGSDHDSVAGRSADEANGFGGGENYDEDEDIWGSVDEGEELGYDNNMEADDDEDSDPDAIWILPPLLPPCKHLARQELPHLSDQEFELCNRGVPFDMISKFQMEFVAGRGIKARYARGIVWLGWNMPPLGDLDVDGSEYINHILEERVTKPWKWEVVGNVTFRKIRQGGPEDSPVGQVSWR
ncbi:hypothetical protein FRB99_005629 [Tulasnella sp. 403]|nr:hypothetical protein FRB99_005629 [Tulasnella sp. 403]